MNYVEPLETRVKRFEAARAIRQRWSTILEQAYRWMLPDRMPLNTHNYVGSLGMGQEKGDPRNLRIFDNTGAESVDSFANNLQTMMIPQFKDFFNLDVQEDIEVLKALSDQYGTINEGTINSIKNQLNHATSLFFYYLSRSDFFNVVTESFQDLSITLGVILLNEGDLDNPLKFVSVSANEVVIEGGIDQSLKNFWRPIVISGRNLKIKWPKVKLNAALENIVERSPDEEIKLIESTLYYPQNPEGQQIYYCLMTETGDHELLSEWRSYDPWIAFRGNKSPGEVMGRGPALTALPFVRTLNKLMEFLILGLAFQACPVFLNSGGNDINPHTVTIEPGAVIRTPPGIVPQNIISRLDTGAGPTLAIEWVLKLQEKIKEIMFSNPIGPETSPSMTATQSNILDNNWVRKNSGFISRLSKEFFPQVIDKCFHVLHKKGKIPFLNVNGKHIPISTKNPFVKVSYLTPLEELQNETDVKAIQQAVVFSQQMFGGLEGLTSLNFGEIPEEYYEKINLPRNLINLNFKNSPLVQKIKELMSGQSNQQTPSSVPGNTSPEGALQTNNSLNPQLGQQQAPAINPQQG